MFRNDVDKDSLFIVNLVKLKEISYYLILNYGLVSLLFYIVFCLWVGVFLLILLLCVDVEVLVGIFSYYYWYFGWLLIFLFIGLM